MLTVFDVWGKLIANHFADVTVKLPDGSEATIAPCSMKVRINGLEDCEFFMLISEQIAWKGGQTLFEVVERLNEYAKECEKHEVITYHLENLFQHADAKLGWHGMDRRRRCGADELSGKSHS